MSEVVKTNKQGQSLGPKGHKTRLRLMDAARKLLKANSPVELTAVSIAKRAKSSSATFYIYFADIRDLLIALSEAAEADMVAVHDILDEPWDLKHPDPQHVARVVQSYASVWEKHREVLRFRNLEADRGDAMFESIRLRTSIRIVKRFAELIFASYPLDCGLTRRDAMAEASVLVAAMERVAATDPQVVEQHVGFEALWSGLTRVIAKILAAPLEASAEKVATASARFCRKGTGKSAKSETARQRADSSL